MKESPNSPYNRLVFRETFSSETETRKQASSVTDVTFSNGVGSFNGTSSGIVYPKNFNGTYSIRIRFKEPNSFSSSQYLCDFRQGTGVGYVYCSETTILSPGGTKVNVNCGQCGEEIQVELGRYNQYHKRSSNPNFFCSEECRAKYWSENYVGETAGMWKGGVSPLQKAVRSQQAYYKWRNECMERDNFECQYCNSGDNLIVHHINPMVNILEKYNITTPAQARECDELWDIHNGITLCEECHKLEHPTRGKIE